MKASHAASVRTSSCLPTSAGPLGGVAVDRRQIAVVPVNRVAAVVQLIPRDSFDHARAMADDNASAAQRVQRHGRDGLR